MFAPLQNFGNDYQRKDVAANLSRIPEMTRVYHAARRELARIQGGDLRVQSAKADALASVERLRASLLVAKNRLLSMSSKAVLSGAITQQQFDALKSSGLFSIDAETHPAESLRDAAAAFSPTTYGLSGLGLWPLVIIGGLIATIVGAASVIDFNAIGNAIDKALQATGDVIAKATASLAFWGTYVGTAVAGRPLPSIPSGIQAPFVQTPEQKRAGLPTSGKSGFAVLAGVILAGIGLFVFNRYGQKGKS